MRYILFPPLRLVDRYKIMNFSLETERNIEISTDFLVNKREVRLLTKSKKSLFLIHWQKTRQPKGKRQLIDKIYNHD